MSTPPTITVVRSCAFCGEPTVESAADVVTLAVRTPANAVASFQAHVSCLADAMHSRSRAVLLGMAVEPTQLE